MTLKLPEQVDVAPLEHIVNEINIQKKLVDPIKVPEQVEKKFLEICNILSDSDIDLSNSSAFIDDEGILERMFENIQLYILIGDISLTIYLDEDENESVDVNAYIVKYTNGRPITIYSIERGGIEDGPELTAQEIIIVDKLTSILTGIKNEAN